MAKDVRGRISTEIVQAVNMRGFPTSVAVSLLDTTGGLQIGLRIDEGTEVILPDHAAINLSVRLQETYAAKLKEQN